MMLYNWCCCVFCVHVSLLFDVMCVCVLSVMYCVLLYGLFFGLFACEVCVGCVLSFV